MRTISWENIDQVAPKEEETKPEKPALTWEDPIEETPKDEDLPKDEETPPDPPPTEVEPDPDIYKALAKDLENLGIWEGADTVDKENFYDKFEETVNERAMGIIETWRDNLGEREFEMVKYLANGGSVDEFFSNQNPLVNLKDPEQFLRAYHKSEGLDEDDIEDKIEMYKERDTLEKYYDKYHKVIESKEAQAKAKLIEEKEKAARIAEQKEKEKRTNLLSGMKSAKAVKDFEFSDKEKEDAIKFALHATEKTKNGYLSPLQVQLAKDLEDPETLLVIANLVKNRYDLGKVKTTVAKKAKDQVKTELDKVTTKPTTGRQTDVTIPVWEHF